MTRTERCPICHRPATAELRPFCSPRCADVDLGRWLDNSYAIPVDDDELSAGGDERDADAGHDRSA